MVLSRQSLTDIIRRALAAAGEWTSGRGATQEAHLTDVAGELEKTGTEDGHGGVWPESLSKDQCHLMPCGEWGAEVASQWDRSRVWAAWGCELAIKCLRFCCMAEGRTAIVHVPGSSLFCDAAGLINSLPKRKGVRVAGVYGVHIPITADAGDSTGAWQTSQTLEN